MLLKNNTPKERRLAIILCVLLALSIALAWHISKRASDTLSN